MKRSQVFNLEEADRLELEDQIRRIQEGRDAISIRFIIVRYIATEEELIWLAQNRIPMTFDCEMTAEQRNRVQEMWSRWDDVMEANIYRP